MIADLLDTRTAQAGAPSASPHDLRRTFISTLLVDPHTTLVTAWTPGHACPPETATRQLSRELPLAEDHGCSKGPGLLSHDALTGVGSAHPRGRGDD